MKLSKVFVIFLLLGGFGGIWADTTEPKETCVPCKVSIRGPCPDPCETVGAQVSEALKGLRLDCPDCICKPPDVACNPPPPVEVEVPVNHYITKPPEPFWSTPTVLTWRREQNIETRWDETRRGQEHDPAVAHRISDEFTIMAGVKYNRPSRSGRYHGFGVLLSYTPKPDLSVRWLKKSRYVDVSGLAATGLTDDFSIALMYDPSW